MLIRRLSKILGETIVEIQHAFSERRQILSAVLVANEVVDDLVSNKRERALCKLDGEGV